MLCSGSRYEECSQRSLKSERASKASLVFVSCCYPGTDGRHQRGDWQPGWATWRASWRQYYICGLGRMRAAVQSRVSIFFFFFTIFSCRNVAGKLILILGENYKHCIIRIELSFLPTKTASRADSSVMICCLCCSNGRFWNWPPFTFCFVVTKQHIK